MLAIVTNIPTPYRTAFFNILNSELLKVNSSLHVIYCAQTEPGRYWKFSPEENNYSYTFLKGFHPEFKNFYPHINFGLINLLKKIRPTWLILAGSWNAPATINVILRKNALQCPVVFWSEGHFDARFRLNKYIEYLRKFVFRSINYYVVPNSQSQDYILHYNPQANIGFLPNTVDEKFFGAEENISKDEMREVLNLPLEKTIIVLVSSLYSLKGVVEFYDAFKLSNKPNLFVVQIGSGECYDTLRDRISKDNNTNYILTGQLNAVDVKKFLFAADVFALPTKLDSNPLSPIEASFVKKALLISSKAGNVSELIPNNQNGWVIEEINVKSISNTINIVSNTSREKLEEMGEKSFEIVSASFTRKKAAENLISFLQKIKK